METSETEPGNETRTPNNWNTESLDALNTSFDAA